MDKKKIVALAVASNAVIWSGQSQANQAGGYPLMGGSAGNLYPALSLMFGHDNNLFQSSANEKSSGLYEITPMIGWGAQSGAHEFGAMYEARIGRYDTSSDDNYERQRLDANANLVLNRKLDVALDFIYQDTSDPRGSTDRPALTEPDEWHATGADVMVGYGADRAPARLEVSLGGNRKRYDNNSTFTAASELDTTNLGALFLYEVMPKTSLLFEVEARNLDYRAGTLDSEEYYTLFGGTWEATAQTSGTVKVGFVDKDFDVAARDDFDGASWQIEVLWSPLPRTDFQFTTYQIPSEATGIGDTIVQSDFSVGVRHELRPRLVTAASLTTGTSDYEGSTREDDRDTINISANYEFQRWLTLRFDYIWYDNESNLANRDYDRNQINVTLVGTL